MVVISPRFAFLASLCAVLCLVLPPPAKAAHLGSYYTASPYYQQRTHTNDGSFSGGSTTVDRHNDEKAQDDRGLPPLLRRHHSLDHDQVHDQRAHDPHDYAHHKVVRSAFARSRYRREPVLNRRSSVYVPGERGNTYIVSRAPPGNWEHTGRDRQLFHAYNRRRSDEGDQIIGRVDIIGPGQSPGGKRLASLAVDSTSISWTSDQSSATAFPLNASTTNQTQFIMLLMDELSDATGNPGKHVTLATEVFDAASAEMVMYCATYDPNPQISSALVMTPCTGATQLAAPSDDNSDSCADDTSDDSSSYSHESQIFSYDPSSGRIQPISSPSGSGNNANNPCVNARVRRDNGNSTTSSSTGPSNTSTSMAPTTSASQQAQNVMLVYIADALEVPAPSPSTSVTGSTTATANPSTGQTAVFATTITTTTTVMASAMPSGPSTQTVTPAQAAVSLSTPSVSPSVTTTMTSAQPSSTGASSKPGDMGESLEVEVVGVTLSAVDSSSSPTKIATTTTASFSSSGTARTSLDALAVASSIAREMVSPQRVASASVTVTR